MEKNQDPLWVDSEPPKKSGPSNKQLNEQAFEQFLSEQHTEFNEQYVDLDFNRFDLATLLKMNESVIAKLESLKRKIDTAKKRDFTVPSEQIDLWEEELNAQTTLLLQIESEIVDKYKK